MFQPRITPVLQMILAIAQFQRKVHTYAAICIEKLLRVKDKTPQAAACGWSSPIFTGVITHCKESLVMVR